MTHDAHCNHSYHENANHSFVAMCNDGYMETIGDRIARLRRERRLSQQQVADAARVSRVAVTKWERGATKNLKQENLLAICSLFGVSAEELISGVSHINKLNQTQPTYQKNSYSNNLTLEETAVITAYRTKSSVEKMMILKILDLDRQDFKKSA